jgi:hypothetical protein
MSENKRFKDFRTQLNENEYSEVLTGYPNRSVAPSGAIKFDADLMNRANAMLNAISRSTFMHPNEAFIKIKTRLNLMMLDFPWTPYLWSDAGTGNVTLTVTRYGRVDGVDALTGAVRMDGKANSPDGFVEFILSVGIDIGEDGLYRITPQLSRKEDVVVEEQVNQIDESVAATVTATVLSALLAGGFGFVALNFLFDNAFTPSNLKIEYQNFVRRWRHKAEGKRMSKDGGTAMAQELRGLIAKLPKKQQAHLKGLVTRMQNSLKPDENGKIDPQAAGEFAQRVKEKLAEEIENSGEDLTEGGVKGALEDYMYSLPKSAIPELKEVMKMKPGTAKMGKITRVLRKHGFTEKFMGSYPSNVVNDYFDTFYGDVKEAYMPKKSTILTQKVVKGKKVGSPRPIAKYDPKAEAERKAKEMKEEAEQIDEAGIRRLKRLMGASYKAYIKRDDKKHSKMAKLAGDLTNKIERAHARRGGASPEVEKQDTPVDKEKGKVTRASSKRYDKRTALIRKFRNTGTIKRIAAMSEELVGKQHKLDVNKNKRLDSQDFALLRAKKKAVKEQNANLEFVTGIPLMSPDPSLMPKAPEPKPRKSKPKPKI